MTGVPGSLDAAGAPWLALARTGRQLSEMGEEAGNFIAQQAEIGNRRAVARFERQLREGISGFETSLATNQQPETWSQGFEEFADSFQKLHLSDKVPKHQRDLFLETFNDVVSRKRQQIAREAALANTKLARETIVGGVEEDLARRDFDTARAKTEQLRGLVPDHAIEGMQRKIDNDAAFYSIRDEIERDPIDMAKRLDEPGFIDSHPGLTGEGLDRLKAYADGESNRAKSDLWDGVLNNALNDGPEQSILSKEDLRFLADEGMISPEQRASYLRAYHADGPPAFDPQLYNEAFGAISTYDPATDPTGARVAQLRGDLATLPLPKESVAELRTRLDERIKPVNPRKHKLAGDFAKLTAESFDAGRFGSWYSYGNHDDDPRTMNRKVIDFDSYGRALANKRRFTDAFDAWLRNQGDDLDPVKAQETYDQLFERIVLDNDDPAASPLIPGAPPVIDFGRDIDRLLGTPAPAPGKETSATSTPATFGGQPIRPAGTFYRNARPTIFGGKNDPADNGLSAFGGTTGTGGKEGVAIPLDVLKATFPGKDKAWFASNVKVAVKTDDGRQTVLPLADLGTAEHIWQKNGRPVLDLTEGAVKQLGGRPIYRDGKLHGIANLGSLSFALTTDNAGPEADLRGLTWEQAQDAWFRDKKPTTGDQIASGLAALKSAWLDAQAKEIDPEPWGDGTGGGVLPDYPGPAGE